VRVVKVGTTKIIVPLIVSFLFNAVSPLAPVFDPVMCISIADDVVQVSVIQVSSSVTFLRWSETTS
jgi:hypothetical protein